VARRAFDCLNRGKMFCGFYLGVAFIAVPRTRWSKIEERPCLGALGCLLVLAAQTGVCSRVVLVDG